MKEDRKIIISNTFFFCTFGIDAIQLIVPNYKNYIFQWRVANPFLCHQSPSKLFLNIIISDIT